MNKWNAANPVQFENLSGLNIAITGGGGFVGRHLVEKLIQLGADKSRIEIPRSKTCDIRKVEEAAKVVKNKDIVIHAAAKVGGIGFNKAYPADLIYDNAIMGLNIINEAYKAGVKKVVVMGTVCAYPKFTPTPFKETALWDGYPEETNAPYGIAKKMLLATLQAYRAQHDFRGIYLLPANLYGPHDNFDPKASHVIPALIRKFVEAKRKNESTVEIWGDGSASREFLYVDDVARAIAMATQRYDGPEPINLGTHEETSIKYLAETIKDLVGFSGELKWDTSKPNGQPKRQLDVSRAYEAFGFKAEMQLRDGLKKTVQWFLSNY